MYGEAEKCLTTLSVRLGDQEFFFGSHPTSLDATVYAFLAPLLKVPFPSPVLQNYLKACTNLVKFVVRITQRYFPYAIQGMLLVTKNGPLLYRQLLMSEEWSAGFSFLNLGSEVCTNRIKPLMKLTLTKNCMDPDKTQCIYVNSVLQCTECSVIKLVCMGHIK